MRTLRFTLFTLFALAYERLGWSAWSMDRKEAQCRPVADALGDADRRRGGADKALQVARLAVTWCALLAVLLPLRAAAQSSYGLDSGYDVATAAVDEPAAHGRPGPAGPFTLATQGCPQAHCDARMSDNVQMELPLGWDVGTVRRSDLGRMALWGLGCSGNGAVTACSFANPSGPNLVVYDFDGNRLWNSDALGSLAVSSAPLVGADSGVIAVDDSRAMRFDAAGGVIWETETVGGTPMSPVITASGILVLATGGGPVSAYESATGELVGTLTIREGPSDPHFFDTGNTPCVIGDRAYVLAERSEDGENPNNEGRLVALDVTAAGLAEAWSFLFRTPTRASPLCIDDTLYFDGYVYPESDAAPAPIILAVRDLGDSAELLWTYEVLGDGAIRASFAEDPRGGLWFFSDLDSDLIRLETGTGPATELQRIDLNQLIGARRDYYPRSTMTVAGTATNPYMLVSAAPSGRLGPSFLLAVNLVTGALEWKTPLHWFAPIDALYWQGQYTITADGAKTRVVFSRGGIPGGVLAVGNRWQR